MHSLKILLVLLVLFCADYFGAVDALKPDGEGVCIVKTSSQRTRLKTYAVQIKKMCGKKKCVVRKTKKEAFTVTKNEAVCCHGWGYDSENDSCTPLCSTGCVGGRCISPDVCHCDPPAILDEELKNICIMPVCDPPCVNGVCIANNTCQCNSGFKEHNSTHCFHCDPGYALDVDFNCAPICDQPCVNGNCIGPNICACNPGYRNKQTFECEPVCENPCVNAKCTAPNVCSCLEGYTRVNETCLPRCDSCDNGQCVGPNVCVCDAGFERNEGGCAPACNETCVNGYCSAPNVCSCNEGYVKNNITSRCVKPCDVRCEGWCDEDGKCIGCDQPMKEKVYETIPGRGKLPDKWRTRLVCCIGWKYNAARKNCVFHCRFGCERGKCTGPNTCSCDPPLLLVNNNTCVDPVCEPPCVNGKCVGNDVCSCDAGFEKLNATHCAVPCEPGYVRRCSNGTCSDAPVDPFACVPECKRECSNGRCVAPDVCECDEGYRNESQWQCSPVCDECGNGTCVAPNVCVCFDGYSNKDGKTCTPDCEQNCTHGVCTEPNVCTCDEGYAKNEVGFDRAQEKCMPVCSQECVNGKCESPDMCVCDDGFVKNYTQPFVCYKPCEGACENGVCTLLGECRCNRGFQYENGTCNPIPPVECETCGVNCTEERNTKDILSSDFQNCWCPNDRPCFSTPHVESAEIASTTRLAGLELTWVVGSGVGLLLLILVFVVIGQLWRKRKEFGDKTLDDTGAAYGSVAYTIPDTLVYPGKNAKLENEYAVADDVDPTEAAIETLLEKTTRRTDKTYD